jgi:hypothetical protein
VVAWLVLLAAAVLLQGCTLLRMHEQRQAMDRWLDVSATVRRERPSDAPIIVVLYAEAAGAPRIVQYDVLLGDGASHFIVPPGDYRLLAFEDRNRNFIYDAEPVAYMDYPPARPADGGESLRPGELRLPASGGAAPPFPIDLSSHADTALSARGMQLGTIVELDDPRFSPENGRLGIWAPLDFREQVGGGVFFLEPYDPGKVPVLFVHGFAVTPADWTYLIERLDRRRFQPWLVSYPTGASLEIVAIVLNRAISELRARLGFRAVYVVAHSMGGLVARRFIGQQVATGQAESLPLFVTLSTPWSGHRAAELKPESARLAPSFDQIAPSSTFIQQLFTPALPDHIHYCLLFSYSGNNPLMRGINDGVVTLSSQLRYAAQDEADAVLGLEESHVDILRSERTSRVLNAILTAGQCNVGVRVRSDQMR